MALLEIERQITAKPRITTWLGAASFEERSLGSLRTLARKAADVEEIVYLGYETDVDPSDEGEKRRRKNVERMEEIAAKICRSALRPTPISPYSFGAGVSLFSQYLQRQDGRVVIDVSCLTKVHAIAAAAAIASCVTSDVQVVYSVPENYPGIAKRSAQTSWRDVIVVPFGRNARFFNETNGRGVILLGHEADRLVVALAEIEPAGGAIVLCTSEARPDLGEISRRKNQKTVRQLVAMRAEDWKVERAELEELNGFSLIVEEEVLRAKERDAPVILFPYGPKPFVIVSALVAASKYFDGSWFVYPIPERYDVNYSEGTSDTRWYRVRR